MSKILLPVFVGVFVGAFVVELFRRNNPELAAAIEVKAKRAVRSLRRPKDRPQPESPNVAAPSVAAPDVAAPDLATAER